MTVNEKHGGAESSRNKTGASKKINGLVDNLDGDREEHVQACISLVDIGEECVDILIQALSDSRERVRWGAAKALNRMDIAWGKHANNNTIAALIADLGNKDGIVRVQARNCLVDIGKPAVSFLVDALKSKVAEIRWEAAKALAQIGAPEATQALVDHMRDEEFDVRWLAAEGLISIGRNALEPLLKALATNPDSTWLREGTHHVLRDMDKTGIEDIVQPLSRGLEDMVPAIEVPLLAGAALKALTGK
jgi:HEAT repeat protein